MSKTLSRAQRSARDLELTDAMSPKLRQCVHEFGFEIVRHCTMLGISDPKTITNLVREIWEGARQPRQRASVDSKVDWVLLQAGSAVTAATLVRVLYQNGFIIVPAEPPTMMVDASMDAVNHMGVVSKTEKHRRRLKAAHRAAIKHFWPHLQNDFPVATQVLAKQESAA